MFGKKETPNFIGEYKNALSNEECRLIIEHYEGSSGKEPGGFYSAANKKKIVNKFEKDSTDLTLNFTIDSPPNKIIKNSLYTNIKKYREEYPVCDVISYWDIYQGYNIQKYLPNQGFYKPHCESGSLRVSNRVLAWMFYLNTVTEGGGTRFTAYNLNMKAEVGKLLIWPASFTHVHHGIVSETQIKYIATGWFVFTA